jgi:TRAP-type mannitol/chloroaromatic compound transport system permease small subunit
MKRLKKIMTAVDKINLFTGIVMVYVLLLAVLVISFEVIMRYLFNMPTNWGHESMTLLFAILYITLGGYCHYYRGHVRVDIFYSSLSVRAQAVIDVITSVFFFIYTLALTYFCWAFYWSSQTMHGGGTIFGIMVPGEMSFTDWGPPIYCVKFMMPLGGILLVAQGINWLIRDLHMAITGRSLQ